MGAKSYYDCDVAVVVTNSKLTASAKELALKSGVVVMENFT
jgi:HJR/Mrr/RecB family endonuclease